uniref:ATP synthase complex subunit 8 n=1 Tax=Ibacus ciliatus TaxID=125897 RepID=A0A0U1XIP2_IBACI|nr:ATP synthase F0 subunit 8 [Ibacus ciliatus]AIU40932.1 ATP synthase F0 subunit 8 [Ibacus ciliatus]
MPQMAPMMWLFLFFMFLLSLFLFSAMNYFSVTPKKMTSLLDPILTSQKLWKW